MSIYNSPTEGLSNRNLNSVGSQYSADFNKDTSLLIEKITNKAIFDAAPKQFYDLKLLNMKSFLPVNSDEFFFKEMGYQRDPITADSVAGAVSYPQSQTFKVTNLSGVSTDIVIAYPDNSKGIITSINQSTLEITVTPLTNKSLPAVALGDVIANVSTVEADGKDGWANLFRASTIERHNYVQLFSRAIRYGRVELFKLKNAAIHNNYLSMEKDAMFRQFRIDCSNAFWIGEKGEGTTSDGTPAKLTGGVWTSMVEAGSPSATANLATLQDAFEDMVMSSEFGEYGDVRFAFMAPRIHRILSKVYKDELTRYKPSDEIANLMLKEINIGSSRIVMVPFKRFEDSASFPDQFRNRLVILDMKCINIRQMWAETSGDTLSRKDGIPKNYEEMFVEGNMGVEMNNPLACASVDVQGV